MVCEGLLVNIVASAMMNGVCCIHNMQEAEVREQEHRESLRKLIHVEWERKQVLERELKEQNLRGESAAMQAEERRRLLMGAKIQAARENSSSTLVVNLRPSSPSERRKQESRSTREFDRNVGHKTTNHSEIEHPERSPPTRGIHPGATTQVPQRFKDGVSRSTSVVSSLLDEDESDDEDELDDVFL